jgi:tetratricopeptide (TPR) repeat protein
LKRPLAPTPVIPATPLPQRGARPWLAPAAIIGAGIAAYVTSFSGSFQFDDLPAIAENPTVRQLWPLSVPLSPPFGALTVSGRPLLNLTLAINYAVSQYHPWSYHLVNLAIHLAVALTLYGILRHAWQRLEPFDRAAPVLIAALWAAHPLTTESVTYIVQRAESLMALCYLLTLYCFIRSSKGGAGCPQPAHTADRGTGCLRPSLSPASWKLLSVLACLVGTGTKEVIVSAPVAVLLYDRAFISAAWGEVWRKGRAYYLGLFATWIPLAILVAGGGWDRGQTAGFQIGVSWPAYWLSQGEAMARYLWLCFWPHPLVLEYGSSTAPLAVKILLTTATVGVALTALAASLRGRRWAFPLTASFLILAPTSLIPGVLQFMAEHRFYLPLAAVITGVAAVFRALCGPGCFVAAAHRRAAFVFALFLIALGAVGTARRNLDYVSDLTLWTQSVAARPSSGLAQANVGYALLTRGRRAEALPYCENAVRLDPMKPAPHFNLGLAYEELNRREAALDQFVAAFRINPQLAQAAFRAGRLLDTLGRPAAAEAYLRQSLVLDPTLADAHGSLGVALAAQNRAGEAVAEYERALAFRPDQPEVEFNLGVVYTRVGQLANAAVHYQRAVELRPAYGEAQLNWGVTLCQLGRTPEAIPALRTATRLLPASPEAHANLAAALDESGRLDDAIVEYRRALELRANYPQARFNLTRALRRRP